MGSRALAKNSASLADRAAAIIAQAVGHAPDDVAVVPAGRMTFKYAVTVGATVYIVRFYPRGREHIARFEPTLVERLRQAGLAVPRVVSWGEPSDTLPFMAYERLAGVSLDSCIDGLSDEQLDRICQDMEEQLARLSCLPVAGFGDLVGPGEGSSPDWRSFVAVAAAGTTDAVATRPYLAAARDALLAVRPPRRAIATLSWTDISPENVIVDGRCEFVGLIDFEGTLALQPEAHLGYCAARYIGTRFHDACFKASRIAPEDSHWPAYYAVIRGLRILPYLDMAMPAGSGRDRLEDFLPGLQPACEEVVRWG